MEGTNPDSKRLQRPDLADLAELAANVKESSTQLRTALENFIDQRQLQILSVNGLTNYKPSTLQGTPRFNDMTIPRMLSIVEDFLKIATPTSELKR